MSITHRLLFIALGTSFILGQIAPLSAQESHQTISFQGSLTDEFGDTLNAVVPIIFKIRNSKNNSLLWTETHDSVTVSGGVFHVLLGSITALDDVDFDRPTDLGISVNGDPEMSPRTGLTAAPYAMNLRGALRVQLVDDNVDVFAADNIIGGYGWVNDGAKGVTISGGGNQDNFDVVNQGYGNYATIGGGFGNYAGGRGGIGPIDPSSNPYATVGGGRGNEAFAAYATVPGGRSNFARGRYSLAAGRFSLADHTGTFVWADSASPGFSQFASTGENQFLIRAAGGVGINTNSPFKPLTVQCPLSSCQWLGFRDFSGTAQWHINYDGGFNFVESNVADYRLFLEDGGDVGIGTNAPIRALHVEGSGIHVGRSNTGGGTPILLHQHASDNTPWKSFAMVVEAAGSDNGKFVIQDLHEAVGGGGTIHDRLTIANNGYVGIGTKTPLKSLHVRGDYYGRGHIFLHAFVGDSTSGIAYIQARDLTTTSNIGMTLRTKEGASIHDAIVIAANGDVAIAGNLSKGGGSFKIDHPLDPENKYLYHSFVESPDMMNVYNGNINLDESGSAIVKLPSYFEALNREFRYQLTAIGAPGPDLYVADKVSGNQFSIAGGSPGMEVSWQITGVRKDPYAEQHRIEVEMEKPASERGTYLHPEVYSGTN
jgi:hypothetical protein